MNAEALARALGAKRSGRQWKCRCVAHDDSDPSMIIFDGHTGVQVRCLTCCSPLDIIAVLKDRGVWDALERPSMVHRPVSKVSPDDTAERRAKASGSGIGGDQSRRRSPKPTFGRRAASLARCRERSASCPATASHPPAMIAAFGLAHEIEPGVVAIDDARRHGRAPDEADARRPQASRRTRTRS